MKPRTLLMWALNTTRTECIIWTGSTAQGYPKATINGKTVMVHVYVCTQKHGRRPSKNHDAAHACGNSLCINWNCLSWKTKRQNMRDKIVHGTAPRGERNPSAKLTSADVLEIRLRHRKGGESQASLAEEFGIGRTAISNIINGKTWRHARQTRRTGS